MSLQNEFDGEVEVANYVRDQLSMLLFPEKQPNATATSVCMFERNPLESVRQAHHLTAKYLQTLEQINDIKIRSDILEEQLYVKPVFNES